ncbi:protein NINJA homolog 1-like [Dioscorea cayenensis subsp. rotundata]|uniref:Ninja-family protein n=1 Tax=Dioscorea cayennensis subsp. rotundata TaxID=55577 RepID=A0AB40AFT4_DIOCR|nr:protein NINJA homolog 1-like [Dioscorea cayenensis subsp. rotundata]
MEDEGGLELRLGLSCGGSSGKSKCKDRPSDTKPEEGSSSKGGNMNASDGSFKNFFQADVQNKDQDRKQKQDSFWTDLGKCPAPATDNATGVHGNLSQFEGAKIYGLQIVRQLMTMKRNQGQASVNLHLKRATFKRSMKGPLNMLTQFLKKSNWCYHEKNSRVSFTTDDGSTGENEDIAESEAEGSNSWSVPPHDDSAKCSDIPKYTDKHALKDPALTGSQMQKGSCTSGTESTSELGKGPYGMPMQFQPLNVTTVPYPVPVKVPAPVNAPNTTGFPSPCVMQLMPLANNERPMVQAMSASNPPQLAFGYSHVQLPTLETNSSWAFGSQPQLVSSFPGRTDGASNSVHAEDDMKISHGATSSRVASGSAANLTYSTLDAMKGSGAKHAGEASTYQAESEGKGNSIIFKPKETNSQHVGEGFAQEGSAIRPGIAPNVKFGGSGSYPDLPWVSTTGSGPNGKTISGVTYKYNKDQIKIVCACHGTHMTPEEFVQHANADAPVLENNTGLGNNFKQQSSSLSSQLISKRPKKS